MKDDDADYSGVGYCCSVGLIADIQYADRGDGASFRGRPRYYRRALPASRAAVAAFAREGVAAIVNLGDAVDARSSASGGGGGGDPPSVCLDRVLGVFHRVERAESIPVRHVYGNHELAVASREVMQKKMNIPFQIEAENQLAGYYSFLQSPKPSQEKNIPSVRFIVLDTYDICLQRDPSSRKYQQAAEILRKNNPNANPKSPKGLVGTARRFVSMGGGVGTAQLDWLRRQLTLARDSGEMVIVLSHQPLLPASVREADLPASLAWNFGEVVAALRAFEDVVAACFCGHAHRSGHARDGASGIHYRLVEAALEHPEPTFAVLEITRGCLTVRGYGGCQSATYALDHLSLRPQQQVRSIPVP